MAKKFEIRNSTAEFLTFIAEGKEEGIQVLYASETIWCTQKAMAVLFDKNKSSISRHLSNIYQEGELLRDTTVAKFATVVNRGIRGIVEEVQNMKTKILIFLLCLASLSVLGQTDNTQGTIKREKCNSCGKVISQCQYKGKHPKPQPEKTCSTCGKFISKCQYKGKHPQPEERCTECNKPIKQCSYNGKHPEPEAAGYDVTFTCNVPSATLYIDGRSYGSAYEIYFLKTGNHSIKAVADGYNDYANHININRQNTSFVITMEMVTAPENPTVAKTDTVSNQNRDKHNDEQNSIMVEKDNDLDVLGAQFSDINDSEKKMYVTSYGLKVTMVNEGKFREAGIPVNFCIQKVNDIKVKNVDDLNSIVRDARNSKSPVLYIMGFLRTGRKRYYAVPL